jgi:hypothetical protein
MVADRHAAERLYGRRCGLARGEGGEPRQVPQDREHPVRLGVSDVAPGHGDYTRAPG